MKNQEHIVCIKASAVEHRKDGFVNYELNNADVMLGQRAALENDPDFRQVLPMAVFTCNGKVWAYERTPKSGESRLHGKVAVTIGGHWDSTDCIMGETGVMDVAASMKLAMERELDEEVNIKSKIISSKELKKRICADDTEVDRLHMAVVYVHELDGEQLESSEDQLKGLGFISPEELLSGKYNIEAWARLTCELLTEEQ